MAKIFHNRTNAGTGTTSQHDPKRSRVQNLQDFSGIFTPSSSCSSSGQYSFSTILNESSIPLIAGTLLRSESNNSIDISNDTDSTDGGDDDDDDDDDDNNNPIKHVTSNVDPFSSDHVGFEVAKIVKNWGMTASMPPDKFLQRILSMRGYSCDMIPAIASQFRKSPTQEQIDGYDNELVTAVRMSDLPKLKALRESGRNLRACNQFGESIMHMACRRSDIKVILYLIDHVPDPWIVDDFGRTPLHDACWRPEPRFDIVTLLLDKNLDLLRFIDIRGASPLQYVRKEDWIQWCAYLFHQKEKYWK